MEQILTCSFERWSPGIGDPTLLGWSTVAVYFAVAVLALCVARRAPFPFQSKSRERFFWLCLFGILCFLGVNKQLDLQTFLTDTGRCAAKLQGWYQDRRMVQGAFLALLAGSALLLGVFLLWMLRGSWRRSAVPILGLCFVMGFVLMRAVGFHHFDAMINQRFMELRLNGWFELTGPVLIALSALSLIRR